MKNILKKVDRVGSIVEAQELERLGVDLIGVSLGINSSLSDNRSLDLESIISIKSALFKSKLVVEFNHAEDISDIISLLERSALDYIQLTYRKLLVPELKEKLLSYKVGIIYGGIEVSYDDDPTWILNNSQSVPELNVTFYQIDLFGDLENSWDFLKNETPKYEEEFQIEDILCIANENPVLITLDFKRENISEIIETIPSIKGISMALADCSSKNNIHFFNYSSVLEILVMLQS